MTKNLDETFSIYVVDDTPVANISAVGLDKFASKDTSDLVTIRFEAKEKPAWPERVYLKVYWNTALVISGVYEEELGEEFKPGEFLYIWSKVP